MKRVVVMIAVLGAVVGLSPVARAQSANLRAIVEAGNQKFSAAFQEKDAATIAGLYTVDGETFPPNADVVRGRDAIQKMWQSVIDSSVASAKLTTREVESAGDLACESGTYELFAADGQSLDHGKYVVVWKRMQGQWRLHRDIWNSSVPAKP